MSNEEDFVRSLRHGIEEVHAVFLLALLPNLRTLRIDGLTPFRVLDWHHFLSRSETALQEVESLELYGIFTSHGEPTNGFFVDILDLVPNLQSVCLNNVGVAKGQLSNEKLPGDRLAQVFLANCNIQRDVLRGMLHGQHITTFRYLSGCELSPPRYTGYLSAQYILDDFTASPATLRGLTLFHDSAGPKVDMQAFSDLECLEVPLIYLWLYLSQLDIAVITLGIRKQVPQSLQTLRLRFFYDDHRLHTVLKAFILIKRHGGYLHLRLVRSNFRKGVPDPSAKVLEGFGNAYQKEGIKLQCAQTD